MGSYWESVGGTRMAGRVLGALLLADPPEISSSELSELLGVSSGSVSGATRELIRPGLAKRAHVARSRQDYFQATMGAGVFPQIIRGQIDLTRRWARLMAYGQELAAGKGPAVQRQLEEIRDFYGFLQVEQLGILERWEKRHQPPTR
jgi:DNA-binding MarR family transcriptional regulator